MLDCTGWRCLATPFSIWLAFNLGFAVIAFLMVYIEVGGGGRGVNEMTGSAFLCPDIWTAV